jgi:divalent metal cation (Fe/Co/Zn/Cd) transporter
MVDGTWSLQRTHELADEIEAVIQKRLPGADVTVHPEPAMVEK